ncbi:MAG: hypothetical protein AB7G93_18515 [Bdellovibrionales bacterium]
MKLLFAWSLSILFIQPAGAQHANSWFCTAYGYDQNYHYVPVSGEYSATEELARESALMWCQRLGYTGCAVTSCFNLTPGPRDGRDSLLPE